MCIGVHVFDAAPVADEDKFVGAISILPREACLAKDWMISIFELNLE
jgi:hypothetical protein